MSYSHTNFFTNKLILIVVIQIEIHQEKINFYSSRKFINNLLLLNIKELIPPENKLSKIILDEYAALKIVNSKFEQ